jgi:DNA recombination protein RmuC
MAYALVALVAAVGTGLVVWIALRARSAALAERAERAERELAAKVDAYAEAGRDVARLEATLEHERSAAVEKIALLERAKVDLTDTFKALSSEAMQASVERLEAYARRSDEQRQEAIEHVVRPIRESLDKVDGQIQHLERARSHAYGALVQQVRSLAETQERLRAETGNLVTALRAPSVRGRWGEIQLRRVVEMAGMLSHCDFVEQTTATVDDRRLRPDLLVKLPGGKNIVVDAKVPLQAYLEAVEADDEEVRDARLADHARQIRQHIQKLSLKSYWEQFQPSPEFVVLFIPGEAFYSAALQHDPGLIEEAIGQRVLVATPTTLIGVLKAVAYGWQQETVAQSAREVSELGRELYARLATVGEHVGALGRRLDSAVAAYNATIGSLERRVLPAARRLADHGAGGPKEIAALDPVDRVAQRPQAPELTEAGEADVPLELPRARDAA